MGSYLERHYLEDLKRAFSTLEFEAEQPEPHIYVDAGELLPLMRRLREGAAFAFDRMGNITAVDYRDYIEMVYILYSRGFDKWVTVKCRLDREKPVAESMTQVCRGRSLRSGKSMT